MGNGYFDGDFDNDDRFSEDALDGVSLDGNSTFDIDGIHNADVGGSSVDRVSFEEYDNTDNEVDQVSESKTVSKYAIIGGVLVLVVALIFIAITNRVKNGDTTSGTSASAEIPRENVTDSAEGTGGTDIEEGNSAQSGITSASTLNSWIMLDGAEPVEFNQLVESNITVTSISHMALNNNGTIQLKSVISGNISGLVGTYEVEVPYSRGARLNIGDTIDISYQLGAMGNSRIVGRITIK